MRVALTTHSWRRDVFSLLCGVCLGYFFFRAFQDTSPETLPRSHVQLLPTEIPTLSKVEEMERRLTSVMRSCLGPKCFDERMQNIDRVGLLTAPWGWGDQVKGLLDKMDVGEATVVYDTNVPPYGYGKNHGWSRIVRIVRPVIIHAYGILVKHGALSEKMMDQQVRQLVRWQCRLSHVAAHTKMLTVFETDLIDRPKIEIEKIISFIGGSMQMTRNGNLREEMSLLRDRIVNASTPLGSIPVAFLEAGLRALSEEMSSSDDLAAWPCKLFSELDPSLPLSTDLFKPNCSENYVKCTIHYDLSGG